MNEEVEVEVEVEAEHYSIYSKHDYCITVHCITVLLYIFQRDVLLLLH